MMVIETVILVVIVEFKAKESTMLDKAWDEV